MLGHGLSIPIFTLTNWDATTTIPEIASGSIIEVGGSFYQADSNTALTPEAGITDGTVHIKLVPAGGGASVVPTLTNDSIPAWSANKAGWYDSDDKFLPYEMTKAGAVYTSKVEYTTQEKITKGVITDNVFLKTRVIEIGDWNMVSTTSVVIAHGLVDYTKVRSVSVIVRTDDDSLYRNLLSFNTTALPLAQTQGLGSTNITLNRTAGLFDFGTFYSATSYNRGWITITYEA
jgi:hypothetical protein